MTLSVAKGESDVSVLEFEIASVFVVEALSANFAAVFAEEDGEG